MSRFFYRLLLIFVLIVLIVCGLFFGFRAKFSEAIYDLAKTQIINSTSDLINDAIDEQIEAGNIQYDRIVFFEKDLNGRITALKTNMSEVNRLKTDILNLINDEILAMDTSDLGVPFGSFVLPELLAGRGPVIPVQIMAIRNSDASFSSSFTEAGINQTLQKITMTVCVDVTILVLGKTDNFTVSSQVVVAETVIVGQVPETFLQNGGNHGSKTENG